MGIWTDIPNCTWQGPTQNHSGPMLEQRGQVVHIAEGGYEGTISWCKNPASGVSCHFVVAADGRIAQVADTDVTVWTQIAGNGHWISVENEGFTPHPLTPAQVEANAQILAKAHRVYGVPLQLAFDPNGRGLGHHSMGTDGHDNPTDTWIGPTWGHTDCPGPAIYNQKPAIVARAVEIVGGHAPTPRGTDVAHFMHDGDSQYMADANFDRAWAFNNVGIWNKVYAAAGSPPTAAVAAADVTGGMYGQYMGIYTVPRTAPAAGSGAGLTPEELAQVSGAAHDGAAGAIDGAVISSATISKAP
jgi:hypothetical protein